LRERSGAQGRWELRFAVFGNRSWKTMSSGSNSLPADLVRVARAAATLVAVIVDVDAAVAAGLAGAADFAALVGGDAGEWLGGGGVAGNDESFAGLCPGAEGD
jgi:hypothetical protein